MVNDKYCVSKSQWKVIKTNHHLWNLLVPKTTVIILSAFVDSEDEINNFSTSNYVAMADIQSIFQTGQSDFVIATLNIQSINAKFDNLYAIMNNLSASGQYFGAVCLQETWLTSNANVTLFDIPGYKLIHQGSRCTRHGGLIIYLHEKYCYEVRNLYSSSDIWEGLFIDVTGHNLRKRLTIGNIYRPPHDNNNNKNIETFINEMSPIRDKLKKENRYAAISGDFNINLLQINEREKYDDFVDMMCTNKFYPKIMFPTRIAKRSHSLLDQIFCKEQADISVAILLSGISDHFLCVVNFEILNKRPVPPKYIYKRSVTESSIEQYRADLRNLNIHTHLNADRMTDPNGSYQTFENLMQNTYKRHFPQNVLNLTSININYRIGLQRGY